MSTPRDYEAPSVRVVGSVQEVTLAHNYLQTADSYLKPGQSLHGHTS
jgi:hypothetical protein